MPAGQGVQAVAPEEEYLPAGQMTQPTLDDVAEAYFPAAHAPVFVGAAVGVREGDLVGDLDVPPQPGKTGTSWQGQ